MVIWLNKYKPTKVEDIIGHKNEIKCVTDFVNQFVGKRTPDKIKSPNLIITGPTGIGKTLIVDIILKEKGFTKLTTDLSSINIARKPKKKSNVADKTASNSNRTVMAYYKSLLNNRHLSANGTFVKKRTVLVIDDVSKITNSKERDVIRALIKLNNKHKQLPIIVIGNNKYSKIINELRKIAVYQVPVKEPANKKKINAKTDKVKRKPRTVKHTNEITLRPPNFFETKALVVKICKAEKLQIVTSNSDEDDIYVTIIDHSQYDIRRLVNILEELKLLYQDKPLTYRLFTQYQETSKTKDLDPGIYDATKMLLNHYSDIDAALLMYGEERATIPLIVHENYTLNIRQQYPKMSALDKISLVLDISKNISESDKIDGIIYSSQRWNLQSMHGFYSCVMPSYHINKTPGKMRNPENYKYTQDYHKTSAKQINNKAIKKAQENHLMKKVTVYDFLYISTILKTLFRRKDFEKVADLMKPYKLTLKQVESIIKIDKIDRVKKVKENKNTLLTGKQKTIMKSLLEA